MQTSTENKVCAGFFVRLLAFAVDSMIAAIAAGMVKGPISLVVNGFGIFEGNFIFDYTFVDVVGYVCVAAYFVLMTYYTHTTLGKMLFHLEVITNKDEWTFLNVLYRETIGRFLSSILCIGYFAIIVTADKQGFHDMLSDTYVVYRGMKKDVPEQVVKVATTKVEDVKVDEKMSVVETENHLEEDSMFSEEDTSDNSELPSMEQQIENSEVPEDSLQYDVSEPSDE